VTTLYREPAVIVEDNGWYGCYCGGLLRAMAFDRPAGSPNSVGIDIDESTTAQSLALTPRW